MKLTLMNNHILAVALAFVLLAAPVSAQVPEDLPEQAVIPGDALYPVKQLGENIGNVLTIGAENRVDRRLELADRRLAEQIQLSEQEGMSEQEREELLNQTGRAFEREIGEATAAAASENRTDLIEQVQNRTRNNVQVLERVLEQVPEQARAGIQRALDNAERRADRLEQVRERVARGQPFTAAEARAERTLPSELLPDVAQNPQESLNISIPDNLTQGARDAIRDRAVRGQAEQGQRDQSMNGGAPLSVLFG